MNRYKLFKAGVDVNKALKRLNNDKELYEELLERFCKSTYYAQMEYAIGQGETQQAFQAAHALKGAAGNLSCTRLYDSLLPCVEELRKGNLENAREKFPEVKESYRVLMEALQANS